MTEAERELNDRCDINGNVEQRFDRLVTNAMNIAQSGFHAFTEFHNFAAFTGSEGLVASFSIHSVRQTVRKVLQT